MPEEPVRQRYATSVKKDVELDLLDGPDQVCSAVGQLTGIPPHVIVLRQSGVRVPARVKVVDMLARDSSLRCTYVRLPGNGMDDEKQI